MQGHLELAREHIERSGLHMVGVEPTFPFDPPFCYSVGFQLLDPPRPEVITIGAPARFGGRIIKEVFERVRAGRLDLVCGMVVPVEAAGPAGVVRVEAVRPEWAGTYPLLAGDLLGTDPAAVPFLQLVVADADGRWPEDADAHPEIRQVQPLLGREVPWLEPIVHDESDVFADHAAGDVLLALPTFEHGRPEGRYELVTATRVEDDRAMVCQVPWAADYAAVGDVVEARPSDGRGGVPASALVGGAVVERGPFRRVTFRLQPVADSDEHADRLLRSLFDALDRLADDPWRARVSTSAGCVHVNSCEPDVVRAALRPFARDGLIAEIESRSDPVGEIA